MERFTLTTLLQLSRNRHEPSQRKPMSWSLYAPQPPRHGPDDALARRRRHWGALRPRRAVLRATRRRRTDHYRGHLPVTHGQRLRAHAGHPLRRADLRMEARYQRGPRAGRLDLPAVDAHWPHLTPEPAAER